MMQHTPLILGLAAVFDLALASPQPVPGRSVAGETGCGAYGIYCNTPDTFSLCVPTVGGTEYYYFGSVAQGTYCDEDEERIRADNYGNCSPDGQIFCGEGGLTFFECDQGGLISFGATAAGTECIDGNIVACNGVCGTDDSGPSTTIDVGTTTSTTPVFTPTPSTFTTTATNNFTTTATNNVTATTSTSSSTLPSTTTSLGYYAVPADGSLLNGPVFTSPDMTEEMCGTDCQGYPYFALENGDTCNCGTEPPSGQGSASPPTKKRQLAMRQTTTTGCTPCAGDDTECCGAPGYALVYQVTPAGQTPSVAYSSASSSAASTTPASTVVSVVTSPATSSLSSSLSSVTSTSLPVSTSSVISTSSISTSSLSVSTPSTSSISSTSVISTSSISTSSVPSSSSSTSVTITTSTSTATSSSSSSFSSSSSSTSTGP